MSPFQDRFERLELKFLIDKLQAQNIRSQIEPYCLLDAHCGTRDPNQLSTSGYPINSLYPDSPGLAFHHAKERGDANRIKLRIRTYSNTSR
jgi:hypothetical protein